MYCPRCGQQQVSDDMRFCSRCGLPISGLPEWLAGGGGALVPAEQSVQVASLSKRRKWMRRGAKVLFFSGVLFPIMLAISLAVDEGGPLILPFITFIVGLTIVLYSRIFFEDVPAITGQQVHEAALRSKTVGGALPPASSIHLYDPPNPIGQTVRTNELAERPSVTEHTTKLLDND